MAEGKGLKTIQTNKFETKLSMIHKQNSIKDKKADRNSNKSDIVYKNEKLVETTGPQTNFSEIGSHLEAN